MYFVHIYNPSTCHTRNLGPFKLKEEARKAQKIFNNLKDKDGYFIAHAKIVKFDKQEDVIQEIFDEYGIQP